MEQQERCSGTCGQLNQDNWKVGSCWRMEVRKKSSTVSGYMKQDWKLANS